MIRKLRQKHGFVVGTVSLHLCASAALWSEGQFYPTLWSLQAAPFHRIVISCPTSLTQYFTLSPRVIGRYRVLAVMPGRSLDFCVSKNEAQATHIAVVKWCPGPLPLHIKTEVQPKSTAGQWVKGSPGPDCLWMDGLLHVRGVVIPTLNELTNGGPFTLTPSPHTFTHRALLAYPLDQRRHAGVAGVPISLTSRPQAWHFSYVWEAYFHFL